MTPAETAIREALAAGPTPGRWVHLPGDRFVYDCMEDGCRGLPVVGVDYSPAFFDQPAKNLDYVAACNPANVAELLAELDGERNRSQMYADLVRGVAVVLHGEGWSDTSKLPEEVASLRAEVEALRPDAERYRAWRREFVGASIGSISALLAYASTSDDVDAAIDAAKGGGNG